MGECSAFNAFVHDIGAGLIIPMRPPACGRYLHAVRIIIADRCMWAQENKRTSVTRVFHGRKELCVYLDP